jgi:hypothetical protein
MISEYQRNYIAFLDILGFKEMLKSRTCTQIVQIFDEIKTQYFIKCMDNQKPLVEISDIHQKIMSDSICFYISTDVLNALPVLIGLCSYLQVRLWRAEYPILVRGGIVEGDLYSNGDILFGTGLTEAYLLEEKNAKVPRIIMTKQTVTRASIDDSAKGLVQGHLLTDYDGFYFINSFPMLSAWGSKDGSYARFCTHVQNTLDSTTDDSIRSKYLYLASKLQQFQNNMKSGEEGICQNNPQQ